MTSQYQRGRRVEQQVIDYLGSRGYDCVRSAGSKGAVDVVAVHDGELLMIQVKLNEKTVPRPRERRELARVASRVKAVPLLAYKAGDPEDARRRVLVFRELTGTGPRDHEEWVPRPLA